MKVVLTAFGGKLKSEPMDWPENTGPHIRMMMSMSMPRINWNSDIERADKVINKMGIFEATSFHFVLPGNRTAAEYVLVDVR